MKYVPRIFHPNIQVMKRLVNSRGISVLKDLEKFILKALLIILFIPEFNAQNSQLNFDILKNDKRIGVLQIDKTEEFPYTDYEVSTNIEVSFIKKFHVVADEKFRYRKDQLIYSSVRRTINQKPKALKELRFRDDKYVIFDGKENKIFPESKINSNLVLLYFREPLDFRSVYCDNQQTMLDVMMLNRNQYQIEFPNGVTNTFHYKNGKCVQVDVEATFFRVQLVNQSL